MQSPVTGLPGSLRWPRLAARPGRIPSVQVVRALAALLVVAGHGLYEARAFDASGHVARIAEWPLWTLGVDLFFVLSGFIMMWTFGEHFGRPGAWREFLARRLARIVPLYWMFTGLMIAATLLVPQRLESAAFSLEHAILSLLFIPHIAPQGGFHPILSLGWTLMYEMFFYLSFAVALMLPRRAGLAMLSVLFAMLFALASTTSLLPAALRMFWGDTVLFEFLLGVLFYFIQRDGRLEMKRLAPLLLVCASIGIAALRSGTGLRLFQYGVPALGVFSFVYWMLPEVKLRTWIVLVLVGEASYTLYLSHPFVLEAVKIVVGLAPLAPPVALWLFLPAAITAAVAFSLLFHARVERPLSRRTAAALTAIAVPVSSRRAIRSPSPSALALPISPWRQLVAILAGARPTRNPAPKSWPSPKV